MPTDPFPQWQLGLAEVSIDASYEDADSTLLGDERIFAAAAKLGFAGVEPFLSRDDLLSDIRRRRLRQLSQRRGLAIPSVVLPGHHYSGLADDDPRTAREAAEDVRRALSWAPELEFSSILIPFFAHTGQLEDPAEFERACNALQTLCPLAEEQGVVLLYEGMLPAARIRELARAVDSAAFGCYFDVGNTIFLGFDAPAEIRALGSLVRQVHLKDAVQPFRPCGLGAGDVDFEECGRALIEIGYVGWLVSETIARLPGQVAEDLDFISTVMLPLASGCGA